MSRAPLPQPYGGRLCDRRLAGREAEARKREASTAPAILLTPRQACDLELLATGAFSPLEGFMGGADYESVVSRGRLADGRLWPLPVVLDVHRTERMGAGQTVTLRNDRNDILAVLDVAEVHERDLETEARLVYGTLDRAHPGVDALFREGRYLLAGRLDAMHDVGFRDFPGLRLTPRETRARFEALGWERVVAFQTRNPLHRAHEEMCRRAARELGAGLFLHPVVGGSKPGDIDPHTRVRCYKALIEKHFQPTEALLALLPLAMRMAGPREVLLHAIIRRNHGATHMIVGRDHAGPGKDSQGRPIYGPAEAREAFLANQEELGIKAVPFNEFTYVPAEDRYLPEEEIGKGVETLSISGTELRETYLRAGRRLPSWFTRDEIARVLEEAHPPRSRQGMVVWLTGLPSSGKSTVANVLVSRLLEHGRRVTLLDGDVIRHHLSKGLGFTKEDRDTNIRRVGFVASEVARHGGTAICAVVSPYRQVRDEVRAAAENFVEVHVSTPLAVCETRDPKGLYALARLGKLAQFTGIDDPYEEPLSPEVAIDATSETPEQCAERVLAFLAREGYVGSEPGGEHRPGGEGGVR